LQKLARTDDSPRVRAAAVSALAGVGDFKTVRAVAQNDSSTDLRTLALRLMPSEMQRKDLLAADSPAETRAESLRRVADADRAPELWHYACDADAFVAQGAREGLALSHVVTAERALARTNPVERLAGLLILRETRDAGGRAALPRFLRDTDSAVRFAAIQWVAEERLTEFRAPLNDALTAGPATARLFGGYLAALERLDGVQRVPSDEWAGEQYIVRALDDDKTTLEVRRWSLRMLRADHPALSLDRLRSYIAGDDPALRLEAVRTLRDSPHAGRMDLLAQIAADVQNPVDLRAEAVVGLSPSDQPARSLLFSLARGEVRSLRDEALRSLRGADCNETERSELRRLAAADPKVRELVERVLEPSASAARPAADDLGGWLKLLGDSAAANPGDAAAGERIFFHQRSAGCSRCHRIGGRGASVGPELTATTGALSRERLIESIVRPSKEIAPQFATWLVATTAGKSLVGMVVKELATGEQTYADSKGDLVELKPSEIESRRAQSTSIMPDGLVQQLTVQEFRDLLAFLRAQPAAGK
jgi:putative heme-binding domain-containing protein